MVKYYSIVFIFLIFFLACSKDGSDDNLPDGTIRYIEIGSDKIAYAIYGNGFPLIMCNGYSATMDMWSPIVINKLSNYYKVYVFNYPGVGYSNTKDTSQTIHGLAETTIKFANAINVDYFNLMGWSLGTNVALDLIVNHPEKVAKLVLYAGDCGDTVAIQPPEWVVDIMTSDTSSLDNFLSILFPPDWILQHPNPEEYMPEISETASPEIKAIQWKALEKWFSHGGGVVGQMGKIKHDVLLITGNQDVSTPTQNSYILSDSIQNSSLIILNDCGHGAMYQVPEAFSDYIISFLNE